MDLVSAYSNSSGETLEPGVVVAGAETGTADVRGTSVTGTS